MWVVKRSFLFCYESHNTPKGEVNLVEKKGIQLQKIHKGIKQLHKNILVDISNVIRYTNRDTRQTINRLGCIVWLFITLDAQMTVQPTINDIFIRQ